MTDAQTWQQVGQALLMLTTEIRRLSDRDHDRQAPTGTARRSAVAASDGELYARLQREQRRSGLTWAARR